MVSGLKLIRELSDGFCFRTVLIEKGYVPSFQYRAEKILHVAPEILKKVTGLKNPEPIAAEVDMPVNPDLSKIDFLLILDGISDPGNLGTLLRTALASGWEGVFLTTGSTDPFNEKAIRAAKGATFKIPMRMGSWQELKSLLSTKKFTQVAADAKGENFSIRSFSQPIALVLGNEAHGIAPEMRKEFQMIAIPMHGPMESLNVASAGAILMYALRGLIHEG